MDAVARERIYSAIDRPWGAEEEEEYLRNLSAREAVHVAIEPRFGIVGVQTLDLWCAIPSMSHVAQAGTFLLPEWRGNGIGTQLWAATVAFGRAAAFDKVVIQVRATNTGAQNFYKRLGFNECGRLTDQVRRDSVRVLYSDFLNRLSKAARASLALRGSTICGTGAATGCGAETPSRATVTRGLNSSHVLTVPFGEIRTGTGFRHWKRVEGSK